MRILISNDDGIYSPGLRALAEVALDFGEVRVVAPDVEQSSMSHAITSSRPLWHRHTPMPGLDAYRVNGTPADCVALGMFLWKDVDLVLSGINLGYNLGNATWHSGTVAAAKQAALLGTRAIAFSAASASVNFAGLRPWVRRTLEEVLKEKHLPLLNVNVPENPQGTCWTRQSFRHYDGKVVPAKDPYGSDIYWFTVIPIEDVEDGSDRWAVRKGHISITPLRLDLTDDAVLEKARTHLGCTSNGLKPSAQRTEPK